MGEESGFLRLAVPARLNGVRFDRALAELVPDLTRAQLQKLVRKGRVKVDGQRVVRSNFALRGGEALLVHLTEAGVVRPRLDLDWLHVEPEFAVVSKPPGLLTHPTGRPEVDSSGSVSELAVLRFGPLPAVDEGDRPGIVHRLDRDTSGVLVLARTPAALDGLRRQFKARTVTKTYIAWVYGVPIADRMRVDSPLGAASGAAHDRDRQRIDPAGKPALTEFQVLERFADTALVECRPQTGRRHQLRVHLAAWGHPVVGDALYRPERGVERIRDLRHHALHAARLAFDRPGTEERVEFKAELPAGLASRLARR